MGFQKLADDVLKLYGTLICSGGAIGTVKPETFRIRGIDVEYTD
jgi:hypothetical protein